MSFRNTLLIAPVLAALAVAPLAAQAKPAPAPAPAASAASAAPAADKMAKPDKMAGQVVFLLAQFFGYCGRCVWTRTRQAGHGNAD